MIPMLDLKKEYELLKDEIEEAIREVMEHQQWINGPELKRFEIESSRYLGCKYSVGVNSGTDALVIGLRAISYVTMKKERFEEGDEIITTPFTFTATGESILRAGATPVFVDIDEDYNISPKAIERAITNKTKGILVVHLYGNPCKMNEILKIANDNNLFLLEDVAQAFGSKYCDKMVGTIGEVGAFSFFPSKNLGAFGDGGLIVTNSEEVRDFCFYLRNHGGRDKYNVEFCGYNSRLDTLQAAILLKKLKYVDDFVNKRREVARIYKEELSDEKEIKTPVETENSLHTFHQFTIRVPATKRDRVVEELARHGISSMIYYPVLLCEMQLFKNRMRVTSVDNAIKISKEVISLPIGPTQDRDTTIRIANTLKKIVREI